jgi:hypothetical protein
VGIGQTAERDIDADGSSVRPEHSQVVPRAAPAVEDAKLVPACRGQLEQRRDEASKSAEPEMVALSAGSFFEQSIHGASAKLTACIPDGKLKPQP